jgi:hypothetical protein
MRTGWIIAFLCGTLAIELLSSRSFGQTSDAATAYPCNNQHYLNSSGDVVHSPSCGSESEAPHHMATCRDGSFSYSEHHRGTCSHHGVVAHWD